MAHKCFISFKTCDMSYKEELQGMGIDLIDNSLDEAISSTDEEYIMRKIREDHLSDSTVTIHLIGCSSSENDSTVDQRYIKRELQASLYDGENNTRNGILGIVLPDMMKTIYTGIHTCSTCGKTHNGVQISADTTVLEFCRNYYIPKDSGCGWAEDERYCVLVGWEDFKADPEKYIDLAFDKRTDPIAEKIIVYPK